MDSPPSSGEHRAVRPSWTCEDCGSLWPCPERRASLLEEYAFDRLALLVFMSGLFAAAIDDFHQHNIDGGSDLYERFLGWARPSYQRDGLLWSP
ncbi:hypothetical protein GCM10009828_076310 [Actinoplanes couchii]|uniref:Flavin reductase n=1 Tax=Actinoplanes couchii TaxID=403638 RepID=A0ABQ3WZF8_9ACTN|nr:hypothetical protein Aco03nite_000650 [Actinoplanes couchii]